MEEVKIKFATLLDSIDDSDYRGITNPGALCYLNSVLQVLFMTHRFPEALESESARHSVLDGHLNRLFSDLKKSSVAADMRDVAKALGITEAEIYEQRDAVEYFHKILSGIRPEASQMFRGKLEHGVTCATCGTSNSTEALFWTLPLSVEPGPHPHPCSNLQMAFQNLFKPSTVTGDDRIYCDDCKGKRDATIECKLKHPPQILALQLKRIQFDNKQKCFGKTTSYVYMPQKLDTKGCGYELYAHINHYGSLRGGHYIVRIKSYETGSWYCFDDARVRLVNPQPFKQGKSTTKSSSACLLMYRKERRASNTNDVAAAAGGVASEGDGPSFATATGSRGARGGGATKHGHGYLSI